MRTFKRPMFRKGGTIGGGIMDNVVERGQYAESNAKDLDSIKSGVDFIDTFGGSDTGLGDPLTQFLLQVGPNIATQTGGGGIIPNILGAAKEPIANLIKDRQSQKRAKQAIALELYKDLSDSDKTALQEKVEYLMSKEGGNYSKEQAFNMVLPEFRKSKNPQDVERDAQSLKIQDIIDVTSTRSGPTLTTNQANLIFNDEEKLAKANPEAYNTFLRTSSKDKYVYKNDEYEGDINSEAGATLKNNSILGSLPENTYVYDITTGNFIYRQGKRVLKLDLDIQED
jgi:hypothetical protein